MSTILPDTYVSRLRVAMLLPLVWAMAPAAASAQSTCETCHAEQARQFSGSIHAAAQARCHDCHGGEDSYTLPPGQAATADFDHGDSFTGKATRFEVPERCARCHSDVGHMNPYGLPADQLDRYRTSGHGKALYEDRNNDAAVCTDCHDVHAIYKSSDVRSWTHPLNIPATCGRCHGNADMMDRYGHDTAIMTEYEGSVHGRGLLENRDTGMPTCATCHGNHAAMPPGVANVNAICGRCHMQSEQYFLQSPHADNDAFPRCIGCHGGGTGHAIARWTVSPDRLVAEYARAGGIMDVESLTETLHPGLSMLRESCYECHDEDSDDAGDLEAFKRSELLFNTIGTAELEYARVAQRVDEAGRGILLVEDEELLLADARTAAIELSTTQHSLSVDEVLAVADRVLETNAKVESSIDEKEAGLAWRHQVLLPMWAFIAVFGVASYIKYRRLRVQHVKPLTHTTGGPHG